MVSSEWIFCPIDGSFRREDFDCGSLELNEYLKKYAKQNDEKGIAKTFVAISQPETKNVLGYYSTSMAEIEHESLPVNYTKKLPRYPVPAMRIGKLAVDKSMQGRGLGKELLMQCFRSAVRMSSEIGIFLITVDAIDEQAKSFYLKYGFITFENNDMSLFIPMKAVLSLVNK